MKFEHNIEVVLTLTLEEALWLHAAMLHPLDRQAVKDESQKDKDMRRKFYNATSIPR